MTSQSLQASIYKTFEELSEIREVWDGLVEQCGSDIYFTYDWLATWWDHYGQGRDLCCMFIRQDGRPVAALPFCIDTFGLGPTGIRAAKFVGADFTIPVFTPAIEADHEADVVRIVLDELFGAQSCDLASFSPLSGACTLSETVATLCAASLDYKVARNDSLTTHTLFALPESFDAYLASLAKQARSNYRRDKRNLARDQDTTHSALRGKDAVALFDDFIALHEEQWSAEGKLGHFGDWPGGEAFNRALVRKLADKDQLRLYRLDANGETISLQFGFTVSDRHYWRLPARKVGEQWLKAGIGRMALVEMIEALIAEGCRSIEAGPGHYDYKLKHGGVEHPLRRLVVIRDAPLARARAATLLAWSQLLHFAYYRAWFMKLAPRLNLPRKPLWRAWIRTRL